MKKLSVLILFFILVILCSCDKSGVTEKTSSISYHSTTKSIHQNTKSDNTVSNVTSLTEISTVEIETSPDDLYSHFIKKRYEDIYNAQKSEGAEYFENFDKHANNVFYSLYDIDGNGVDELILGDWKRITNDSEAHNPPRKILISSVYTIENGKVVKQDSSVWWNDDYIWDRVLLSNGLIRTTLGDKETPSYSYLGFENGKLKLECAVYYMSDRYFRIYDSIVEEEEITKEEYERLRKEAEGDAEVVEINWKRIDEYGK